MSRSVPTSASIRLGHLAGLMLLLVGTAAQASTTGSMLALGRGCLSEAAELLQAGTGVREEIHNVQTWSNGEMMAVIGQIADQPRMAVFLGGLRRADIPDGFYILNGVDPTAIFCGDPPETGELDVSVTMTPIDPSVRPIELPAKMVMPMSPSEVGISGNGDALVIVASCEHVLISADF
ncbi:MAG: hypothetical protein AAF533_14415 [Acidobacteriota bacterium]